jgi:8-oxoguanine deaminase
MGQRMSTWIKNPLAILAENAGGGIVVSGSRIVELVAAGATPRTEVDETVDASRHAIIPGLINTHHHFFQTLCRAHPAARDKELFPWLQALYPIWSRLDRDMFRVGARLAYAELLLSGCTTAMDHNYMSYDGLEDATDIEVQEAQALGIRATVTRGSLSLSKKDGAIPDDHIVRMTTPSLLTANACSSATTISLTAR